jgi:hypothetical protein
MPASLLRAAPAVVAGFWLLAGCNGSDGTGPSNTVLISDIQVRTLERPRADRPVPVEIAVTVSDPARVIGGTAALRRLQAAEDTCQAPGQSPIVATAPIGPANVQGSQLRIVLRPRLPAGRSRLCFLVGLSDGLPQQARGKREVLNVVAQTNELPFVLDVGPGSEGRPPASPSLPVVTIAAVDPDALEDPLGTGAFRVSRTGSTAAPLTVPFSVAGSAISGSDYTPIGTSVVIPAGSATADITVTPVDDMEGEDPETVIVTISAPPGYAVGGPSKATVTIDDEDPLVRILATSPSSGPEGDPPSCTPGATPGQCPHDCGTSFNGTQFQITIGRTGSTAAALTMVLGLSGTAIGVPSDFFVRPQVAGPTSSQRLFTIPLGASEAKFCVITIAGTFAEPLGTEMLTVTIQPGAAYTVGNPSSTTVTITEDD